MDQICTCGLDVTTLEF